MYRFWLWKGMMFKETYHYHIQTLLSRFMPSIQHSSLILFEEASLPDAVFKSHCDTFSFTSQSMARHPLVRQPLFRTSIKSSLLQGPSNSEIFRLFSWSTKLLNPIWGLKMVLSKLEIPNSASFPPGQAWGWACAWPGAAFGGLNAAGTLDVAGRLRWGWDMFRL